MKRKFLKYLIIVLAILLCTSHVYAAPSVSAKSGIVIEKNSGKILFEKNIDEKVYPASTTKILTALIALEQCDLNEMVQVSRNAAYAEGSSIYLKEGEEIKLVDLLYGLMLRSGNDAAMAIAEHVAGSQEAFAVLMNEKAKSLGAVNSNFVTPSGLHDDNHYTNVYDMALISREAMGNEIFRKIAGTKTWTAERDLGEFNYFYNKNKVIYQYGDGTGIKIGYTQKAGRCLVASSKQGDMELICVVMDAPDWFNDSYALMDSIYAEYECIKIADADTVLKKIDMKSGDKKTVNVGALRNITFPVLKDSQSNVSIEYDMAEKVKAPVMRGGIAGYVHVYEDGNFVYSTPLTFMEDVESTNILKKIFGSLQL